MPTTITSAGVTFTDTTTLTSANGVPSALKLTTARTINGVSFDGTGNITIPATSISGANVAKAWVNFNGTTSPGTIRSSFNVSSVTKNGTGDHTVNFATPMANANYAVAGTGSIYNGSLSYLCHEGSGSINVPITERTVNSIRISTGSYASAIDSISTNLIIFGN